MLRATILTVGLFGAGTAICRAFPATWTEPIVLFVLGLALLFASARAAPASRDSATERAVASVTPVPSKATPGPATVAPAAAAAAERTA
jgi:hypothetical protein